MQFSKLAKKMLKYLPILAVLVAITLGLFLGKDLYSASLDSQSEKPLIALTANVPCDSSNLYTSLPPKCKTFDGKFIPAPGTYPEILVTPQK